MTYSFKKGTGGFGGGLEAEPCFQEACLLFGPRGSAEPLHSRVFLLFFFFMAVTRLLYKQFTWMASNAQRECLMQRSHFPLSVAPIGDADVSSLHRAALSLRLRSFGVFCGGS